VNKQSKKPLPLWLPIVAGSLLVIQFAGLGVWQVSRGLEKRATQHAYRDATDFARWKNGDEVRPYQRLQFTGSFDGQRQVLLENIIVNSRYGYYVVTPLALDEDAPLLLVNRGWLQKTGDAPGLSALRLPENELTVRGRAGSLPRAGYKMGEAIPAGSSWPMKAVYPSLEDIEEVLGREVQPFVLLLDHQAPNGFYRHWVPTEFGPGKHFGYAVQWFAMGAVLSGLLIWNYRKRRATA
jgi:cytochrome oxidase assembly protein ShyY1